MSHHTARTPLVRSALAAGAMSLAVATGGCADDPADEGLERTTVEQGDPEGDPTTLQDLEGHTVTRTGDVRRVISADAFLLGGEAGDQPLLVVNAEADDTIETGATVRVTGVVHTAFDLPSVEDELGRDLDDADLTGHGQAPYLVAAQVETDVQPTQDDEG